jgi:hypothetical protein
MNNTKIIYSIVFGDRFNNDAVSLSINGIDVLKNTYLISDKSDGVTTTWVHISQDKEHFYVSTSESKELKRIESELDKIVIEKDKGKYIVISDNGKGNLIFTQSKSKPIFD